ncbi:MAG: thioredoxin family protein [Propionicimonas sp.]|nr:thioredoxin family protein [Propionicimonas sp.]
MTGLIVVLVAVAAAVSFGLYRRATDGRVRTVADGAPRLEAADLGEGLGSAATFVQFSSTVCAPCRATHALLSDLTGDDPAVAHIDINAEERLDLAERFGILRTPTVLVLDGSGTVRQRITGAPRRPEVLEALASLQPTA